MRRFFANAISVIFSFVRFVLMKVFHPKGLRFGVFERFSPNVAVEMGKNSKLYLGNKVRVHSGSKIKVRKGALMAFGDNVRINYNCIFVARKEIKVGKGTEFGPNVLIYDHDHDYKAGLKKGLFLEEKVVIGEDCWIGANSIILRGTVIGNNCVIGAGSVVKGIIPDGTVLIQKR